MTEYYWCLEHQRVESGDDRCRADNRLGPYATPEAARDWRERHETRDDLWRAQDEAWDPED